MIIGWILNSYWCTSPITEGPYRSALVAIIHEIACLILSKTIGDMLFFFMERRYNVSRGEIGGFKLHKMILFG